MCYLLSNKGKEVIPRLLGFSDGVKRTEVNLAELCFAHRVGAKKLLTGGAEAVGPLKEIVSRELKGMISGPKAPRFLWRRWLRASSGECPLCRELQSEERFLCKALICFLNEMEFWKKLQVGPLLCLDHLRKCMMIGNSERGFRRLVQDQASKLNSLLDQLARFGFTGTNTESKNKALEWLADSQGPALSVSAMGAYPDEDKIPTEILPNRDGAALLDGEEVDPEALRFENEKLKRKIGELVGQLAKVETRAASLHYRAAELSEINKRLEMGYTGANVLANGLEKMVKDLREEIGRLKKESPVISPK